MALAWALYKYLACGRSPAVLERQVQFHFQFLFVASFLVCVTNSDLTDSANLTNKSGPRARLVGCRSLRRGAGRHPGWHILRAGREVRAGARTWF